MANTGLDGLPDKLKTQLPAEIDRGQVAHLTLFALTPRYEGPTLTPTLTLTIGPDPDAHAHAHPDHRP